MSLRLAPLCLLTAGTLCMPAGPARAAVVATGTFSGNINVVCGGAGVNFSCTVYISTITTCFETYGRSGVGLNNCYLYFSPTDGQLVRGTANGASCTVTTEALRGGDPRKVVVVHSPSLGDVGIIPTITYSATSSGTGHGTVTGVLQAPVHTLVVSAKITNVTGCGQDSGLITGTYSISA